jgi:hypothetical protein
MLNARAAITLGALAILFGSSPASSADDPCAAFGWNVARERALFATAAQRMAAGKDAPAAPRISTDRLYDLTLVAQDQVHFGVAPPGKQPRCESAFAGVVRLRLSAPGLYRFSLDQAAWIDVVAADQPIAAEDFQGRSGCQAPHKIVQFVLPAGRDLVLQLSGAQGPLVRLAVTLAPATAD